MRKSMLYLTKSEIFIRYLIPCFAGYQMLGMWSIAMGRKSGEPISL